jgi:hypothetical protein
MNELLAGPERAGGTERVRAAGDVPAREALCWLRGPASDMAVKIRRWRTSPLCRSCDARSKAEFAGVISPALLHRRPWNFAPGPRHSPREVGVEMSTTRNDGDPAQDPPVILARHPVDPGK